MRRLGWWQQLLLRVSVLSTTCEPHCLKAIDSGQLVSCNSCKIVWAGRQPLSWLQQCMQAANNDMLVIDMSKVCFLAWQGGLLYLI